MIFHFQAGQQLQLHRYVSLNSKCHPLLSK